MDKPTPSSLLARARPADLVRAPFPHLVLDDALPAAELAPLLAEVPGYEAVSWRGNRQSNRRFPYAARRILADPAMAAWHAFVRRHVSPAFLAEAAALFGPLRRRLPPALEAALAVPERLETGLLEVDDPVRVPLLQDCRLEINTPVTGAASSVRGPHLDTPNRLFSLLWYLRRPEDDSTGGDLQLWRWRARPRDLQRYEIDEGELELVSTVPYALNRLVVFWNVPEALHGVSPRAPTPHQRQYLFVTAEVSQDLF